MKKLWILIYANVELTERWFEIVPFDEREEKQGINEDKTCFIQKVMKHDVECLKIKPVYGYICETHYYPVYRYSIRQVEISE